ncbi:hypothetical protein POV27_15650 [Aureisphaera galaxeae]|uniref:hypothetical protein n=1 Tax=Aureisphaera galaxeae TaxID=1538023 RepID=UPI0023509B6A|nr:hypothetical protein [Aureisphaera galaxeae]MDC8005492.1 hypothetical protein [Aureisphaera galaxeae]
MKITKYIALAFIVSVSLISCKSDDGDGGGGEEAATCAEASSQTAQGNFRETAFVATGGKYIEAPGSGTGFICTIYVKSPTNTDCVFPTFEGTQDTILFSIDALEPQTLILSELAGSDTLNFNRIADGTTSVELAECGVLEITSYDATAGELRGTVIAEGQLGSMIDGSFVLSLCVF